MSQVIKLLEKRLLFRGLMEAAAPAIYCLINERDKKVYVLSTTDLVKSFAAQVSMLGRRTHSNKGLKKDKKQLAFKVLETIQSPDAFSLSTALFVTKYKWAEYYKNQGYTLYNNLQWPTYKVRVSYTENYMARVDLVTNGRRVLPVKEFKTQAEADTFIATNSLFALLTMAKTIKRP